MTYSRSHGAVVLSLSLLLLSACATEETMTGGGSTSSSSAAMKASTQAYDSLQSCLARIQSGGVEHVVRLFQPDPTSGEAFAQTSAEGPIYKISPSAIKDLTKDLFALQDKRLLGVDVGDIAMLSIKTREEQYVLIHDRNEWVLEDQPTEKLRQDVADLVVSRIVNLPAEERVLKQAGPLAPYGLVAPVAEFVATGKDGRIAGRLAMGNQVGGLVYAIGHRIPGIFQVRPDLLKQIPSRLALLGQGPRALP